MKIESYGKKEDIALPHSPIFHPENTIWTRFLPQPYRKSNQRIASLILVPLLMPSGPWSHDSYIGREVKDADSMAPGSQKVD